MTGGRRRRFWPDLKGVGRDRDNDKTLILYFDTRPSDDELRALHDHLAAPRLFAAVPLKARPRPDIVVTRSREARPFMRISISADGACRMTAAPNREDEQVSAGSEIEAVAAATGLSLQTVEQVVLALEAHRAWE